MSADFLRVVDTPIGRLAVRSDGENICALEFGAAECRRDAQAVLLRAEQELTEYFAGRRKAFSVPLCISGTDFQMRIWRALAKIPYGETRSYGQIAALAGNARAYRAAGMACHKNPLPIFLPCHRVVGADGKITGYAGGIEIKRYLLELEGRNVEV